jgi:hypothetical protein
MKDKIDQIFTDLKNEVITEKEAHTQVLLLFSVSGTVCDCKERKQISYHECCGSDCKNIKNIEH